MSKQMLFVLIFIINVVHGQPLRKTSETPISEPYTVSIDQEGQIYLADYTGNLYKYDSKGKQISIYSPQLTAKIYLLEAWSGLRIFCFLRDIQEYTYLNRFLTATGNYGIDPDKIGFAEIATPSFDNNLWIIDQSDFSLKKYDITHDNIQLNTPLDLLLDRNTYQLKFMKEYQNKLYISDKSTGIFVFDNLGNYQKKINQSGVEYFNFIQDQIYFLQNNQLHLNNLYNNNQKTVVLPVNEKIKFALIGKNGLYYFFTAKKLLIYQ